MSTHTPACELLGIALPIIEAPLAADPRLPAAVSNAGGLGSIVSIHSSAGTCTHHPHLECQLGTVLTGHSVVVKVKARPTPVTAHFVNRAVVGTATLERTLQNNVDSVAVRVVARQKPPAIGKG